jgi:alpha-D-ribose 1-methylphosphonate 5-triphosphate synthase subunit PhnI
MTSKVKRRVVVKSKNKPARKMKSAIFSYHSRLLVFDLRDKNENTQLAINRIIATNVISSMIVFFEMSNNLREVKRMKQMPNKLEEAERM